MKKVLQRYLPAFTAATLSLAPLVAADKETAKGLESKVYTEIQEIDEKHIMDSYPRLLANNVKEVKRLLMEADDKKIDLSKEYASGTTEYDLRRRLTLATRSLTWRTLKALRNWEYEEVYTEPIFSALRAAEQAFGNHALSYVQRGRQKVIAQALSGNGIKLRNPEDPGYRISLKAITDSVLSSTEGKGYAIPQHYAIFRDSFIEP